MPSYIQFLVFKLSRLYPFCSGCGTLATQPVFSIPCKYGYKFFAIPKCIFRMRLNHFDPYDKYQAISHDFLAVHDEELYSKLSRYSS